MEKNIIDDEGAMRVTEEGPMLSARQLTIF